MGGGNARRGLRIRILDFFFWVRFSDFFFSPSLRPRCALSLSLRFCVMMALYYPYFLGLFLCFSLSFYGIPFLCPNDLHVQISGHLIPILFFFLFSCMFLLLFWNLICCCFISYLTRYFCISISLLL